MGAVGSWASTKLHSLNSLQYTPVLNGQMLKNVYVTSQRTSKTTAQDEQWDVSFACTLPHHKSWKVLAAVGRSTHPEDALDLDKGIDKRTA